MPINRAFRGQGIFTERPRRTLNRFDRFVSPGDLTKTPAFAARVEGLIRDSRFMIVGYVATLELVTALRGAGISLAAGVLLVESRLRKLGDRFVKWSAQDFKSRSIIGFNWYHAGLIEEPDEGAMSDQMILDIASRQFHQRPYAVSGA